MTLHSWRGVGWVRRRAEIPPAPPARSSSEQESFSFSNLPGSLNDSACSAPFLLPAPCRACIRHPGPEDCCRRLGPPGFTKNLDIHDCRAPYPRHFGSAAKGFCAHANGCSGELHGLGAGFSISRYFVKMLFQPCEDTAVVGFSTLESSTILTGTNKPA